MPRTKLKDITPEQLKKIEGVIRTVWDVINPDMGRCTNIDAIETCLDADRPIMFAGDEGKEVTAILKNIEETPTQVDRFLAKRINLA